MNYYEEIKNELIENEIYKKAKDYSKNKSDLMHYYNVGKLLIEAQGGEYNAKYGNKLIKEYSKRLTIDLGKGYSWRNLYNMRSYYIFVQNNDILQPLAAKITWTNLNIILSLKNNDEMLYYINQCEINNLSKRDLIERIKNKDYERLDNNTKNKLIKKEETIISDFIKNPIVIKNNLNIEVISEKYLKKLILEDIKNINHDKTIGIIICKHDNKLVLEYSSDKGIFSSEFILV